MKCTFDKIKNILKTIFKSNIFKTLIMFLIFSVFLYFILLLVNGPSPLKIHMFLLDYLFSIPALTFWQSLCLALEYYIIHTHLLTNILLILGIVFFMFGLIGKIKPSVIIAASLIFVFGIINCLLISIRSTPFTAADFASIGLATSMVNNFTFNFSLELFLAFLLFVLLIILVWKTEKISLSKSALRISRISSLFISISIFLIFFTTNLMSTSIYWDTLSSYKQNGFILSFFSTIKSMKVTEPDNYSVDNIENLISDVELATENNTNSNDKPNIIAIMNESLADLASVYNLNLSEDNMAFIHSLQDNTVKGNLHSSALGGRTANCEFEFLTR